MAQHLFASWQFSFYCNTRGTRKSVTVVVDKVLAGSSCGAAACGPSSDSWLLEPIMKSITFKSLAVSVLPILVVKVVHQFCLVSSRTRFIYSDYNSVINPSLLGVVLIWSSSRSISPTLYLLHTRCALRVTCRIDLLSYDGSSAENDCNQKHFTGVIKTGF